MRIIADYTFGLFIVMAHLVMISLKGETMPSWETA
jgi:hypothetical protein